jgi:hypothetical protein
MDAGSLNDRKIGQDLDDALEELLARGFIKRAVTDAGEEVFFITEAGALALLRARGVN